MPRPRSAAAVRHTVLPTLVSRSRTAAGDGPGEVSREAVRVQHENFWSGACPHGANQGRRHLQLVAAGFNLCVTAGLPKQSQRVSSRPYGYGWVVWSPEVWGRSAE